MFVISSKVWLGGRTDRPISSGDSGRAAIAAFRCAVKFPWVRITQRLFAVVPEVKYSAAMSSGFGRGLL